MLVEDFISYLCLVMAQIAPFALVLNIILIFTNFIINAVTGKGFKI